MSVADDSISERELGELVGDLRDRLGDALELLRVPALAGRGKSERLGRMYLRLTKRATNLKLMRRVGNFGLTCAAYRNLDRLAE